MVTVRRSLMNWLAGRATRAAQRKKATDFADYGTAFGLDMSMGAQTDQPSQLVPAQPPASTGEPTKR
jgi:hypothetical protein